LEQLDHPRRRPRQEVAELKEQIEGIILVAGSAQLVRTLVEHDLMDEHRLMVFPVILGTGKRLFGETSDRKPLRLTRSTTVGGGVNILVYTPLRGAIAS